MGGLIFLSIFTGVGVTICLLILWGTSGDPNEWPALGTNVGQAGFGMVWWRRRGNQRSVTPRPNPHDAPSWMQEPGAFARDGLVDAEDPAPHPDEKAG